jgi:Flp pilus assembly protein TadG
MPASPLRHPLRLPRRAAPTAAADLPGRRSRAAERGQVIVIFAGGIVLFMLLLAVVVDVSWYWANTLRVQRAADAAALAGAVYLPGNVGTAVSTARAEATKNGYVNGTNAVVTPTQDTNNNRQLNVTVSANVGTFFMRVIGISSIAASRSSKAEYVLPVPMGSPENYYGVYGLVRTQGGGTTTYTNGVTGWVDFATTKGTNAWGTPDNVYTSNDARAASSTDGQVQQWGFTTGISFPGNLSSIRGVEVAVEARTTAGTSCQVRTELSWDNGSSWTSGSGTGVKTVPAAGLTTTDPATPYYAMGGATDLWGRSSWSAANFSASNFRIRLTNRKPSSCTGTTQVDYVRIRVHYQTSTFVPDANLTGPQGQTLTPRGFWAEMLSQGAETISGDAYLPFYDTRTSGTNAKYNQQQYYNYAVEVPPGATGGSVWLYDPGFCAGDLQLGLGDNWVSGNSPVSAFYDLYNSQNTPYNLNDDTLVASSGTTFRRSSGTDGDLTASTSDTPGPSGCGSYHLGWYQLASGLSGGSGGTVYRLHTSTVDPTDVNDQKGTNARNGFAIYVSASGGTGSPRVYGIGAMEMFTPLPGGQSSEFYLAQIEAVHAGKTMEIRLWDPGDTNQDANIQILAPSSGGWGAASFTYTAARGTTNSGATACNSTAGSGSSVVTYASGASRFNGCWLTILIPIPPTYAAPQDGWWKIRYNMTGSSTATDITTWEVNIRGNPVHLKVP